MSGGKRIRVHKRILPALEQVSANLAASQAAGRYYPINTVSGFAARTVSGKLSMSYHSFGAALDINRRTNPYREDNVLISDMPAWFVRAWTDAGFCWGGHWLDSKDTMHFSWEGPMPTPGYLGLPPSYPVRTVAAGFVDEVEARETPFGVLQVDDTYLVADATGNGAADVVHLVPRDEGVIIEVTRADMGYAGCSVERFFAYGAQPEGTTMLMGDFERSGRNDLWQLDTAGHFVDVTVFLRSVDFEESVLLQTAIVPAPDDVYLLADWNRDGYSDLIVVRRDSSTRVEVWDGAGQFRESIGNKETPLGDTTKGGWMFALADRDLDGVADLHALAPSESSTVIHVLGFTGGYGAVDETIDVEATLEGVHVVEFSDFDGDGRSDLLMLDDAGRFTVRLGNVPIAGLAMSGWFRDPNWECPDDAEPYPYAGSFQDDDGSVFERDIEWLESTGITRGCDPPYGTHFCPDDVVTRGQMAAFLHRALGDWLTPDDPLVFNDDVGSIFEADVAWLSGVGITKGCNPPVNDLFCPDEPVTRGQMAAFLVRAFGLSEDGGGDLFADDGGSVFESDIDRLGAAGITRGCNPPDNTLFCPDDPVTRGQMAAFLRRAETWILPGLSSGGR